MWILCADTSLSLGTLGKISGETCEKTHLTSGHGVQLWRSRQLQSCCKQLSSVTQPAPRLPKGGCPTNHCFQWLEQTDVRKRSTWEIFVSTLNDWFVCDDFLTEVWSLFQAARTAASMNCQSLVFWCVFFLIKNTEFYFSVLILLLNFVEGFWSSYVLSFVLETSVEFYFLWFSPCVASALSLLHI